MNNKILIITHTQDSFSLEKVTEFIAENNFEVIRFDVDLYPLKNQLSTVFENGKWVSYLKTEDHKIRLDDISAVWYRRAYNIGTGLKEELETKFFGPAMGEIKHTLFEFMGNFKLFFFTINSTVNTWLS